MRNHLAARRRLIYRLVEILFGVTPAPQLQVSRVTIGQKTKSKSMKTAITTEQYVDITLSPKTLSGRPARVDGTPVWSVESGIDLVDVIPSPNGLVGRIAAEAFDRVGIAVVRVTADVDVGEGIEPVFEEIEVAVTGPKAATLGVATLVPQLIPEAGPGEPSDPV